jgi:hypothetical protein
MKALALIVTILNIIERILTYVRDRRLKDEGRAELEQEILSNSEAVQRDAEEIERGVAGSDLSDLQQRMRKYQR